jgi:hypothetical protein
MDDDQMPAGPPEWPDGDDVVPPDGGDGDADGVGGSGDGSDGDAPPPAPRMTRGRLAVLIASVVVAIGLVGFLATRKDDTTPVTTTTSTTTSTTAERWPAQEARIATANVPDLLVYSSQPVDWAEAEPVAVWESDPPPASQPTMPPRPALPRLDFPIAGRHKDAAGWRFSNPTSFGDPFTMLVIERRGEWIKVQVPVRPNGTEGWVRASDVDVTTTPYRLELELGQHRLRLYKGDDVVMETEVVIGAPGTKTPTGRFYVTDKVEQRDPNGAYGPLALPLSAYSEQIDEFDDGVPVIALHGTNHPELVGKDVSNGCIRMPNDKITKLGATIPQGTPIDIVD